MKNSYLLLSIVFAFFSAKVFSQVTVASTGGTPTAIYANLNAFFAAVNAGTHTGVINATITANISEGTAFTPTPLNASGQGSASFSRINIGTTGSFTVSGSPITGRSLLELNGADNVTIDGNFSGNRSLTLENNAATTITATAVIRLIGATSGGLGCANDTIRNCIIIGNGDMAATSATTQYGIYAGGTANPTNTGTGDLHANLVVNNNVINRATTGIHIAGTTVVGNNASNITITNNIIGSHSTSLYVRWRGIALGNATNSMVRGNTIFNLSSAIGSSSSGIEIFGTASNANTFSHNHINRVYNFGTSGWAANGINANGGTNHLIVNNVIWDMLSTNYSTFSTFIAAGIRLTSGTGHRVVYNSVHLFGACTVNAGTPTNPTSAAFFVSSTAVTGITLRNNILSNKMTSTFSPFRAFAALFPSSYNMSTAGNTINNNSYNIPASSTATTNYFVGGLNSAATLYPTLASWRAITLADQNSVPIVNQVAPFTNDSTLSIPAFTLTEIESGGFVMTGAGITTPNIDFNFVNRPAFGSSAPDIGAIEFNGIPADLSPPTITYTPLTNTASVLNRVLVVTITDASRIDTAINAPRLYYKLSSHANAFGANNSSFNGWKFVSTSDTATPFNFTIDYSLLFGGAVAVNDTVQYFVIAQDRSGSANTATLPAAGFGGGRVDSFIVAPTPNFYVISPPPLGGSYTVGNGGDFTTLTNAINSINLRGVSSNVTLRLTDTLYSTAEVFPIQLNDNIPGLSGSNRLIIRPDSLINSRIIGFSSLGLIKLNGTDNVTIEGSNNNTNTRNLTIINTAASTTAAVIWLASSDASNGATNNIIRNCNIYGNSLATTYAGVFIGGTSTIAQTALALAPNNANQIINNEIHTLQFGILNLGAVTATDSGLVISNNLIGSEASGLNGGGIAVYFSRFATITRNTIQNVRGSGSLTGISGTASLLFGMYIRNNQNSLIRYNIIHTVAGGSSQRIHGLITESPNFNLISNPSNNTFADNVIYHIHNTSTGNTAWSVTGLGTYGGYGDRILFNSVQMSHPTAGNINAAAGPFAAFANGNTVQTVNTPNIEIRNNLFVVSGTSVAGATPYTHYTNLTSYATAFVNNNRYFQNSSGTTASHIGFFNALARTTFADWQAATSKDTNSSAGNPILASISLLRPDLSSPLLNAGSPVPGFTTDILNITRNALTPTIGAYEQGIDVTAPVISYTLIPNQVSTSNLVLNGFANIADGSGVDTTIANRPRLYYKKSTESNDILGWKSVAANNTSSPFSFTINYSLLTGGTVIPGDTIQYFIIAQDRASTPNIAINSGVPAAPLTAVVLSAAQFPISGAINRYIIATPLPSAITVGTGGIYPSFTGTGGLFEAINGNVLSANTSVTVLSNISESGTHALNGSGLGGFTLTITPALSSANYQITGASAAPGLFRFNNVRGLKIDGGTNKSLQFSNNSTLGPVFHFFNDCIRDTITNVQILGNNTTTGNMLIGQTAASLGNDSLLISNCIFRDTISIPTTHINSTGTTSAPNSANLIINNEFLNFSANAINITATGNGDAWTVFDNKCYQTAARITPISVILVSAGGGHIIRRNSIGGAAANRSGVPFTNTSSYIRGIDISSNSPSASTVDSNLFSNIVTTATAGVFGVYVNSGNVNINANTFGGATNSWDTIQNGYDNGIIAVLGGTNISVTNNLIANIRYIKSGGDRTSGILVSGAVTALNISRNIIRDLNHSGTGTGTSAFRPSGMVITGGLNNASITDNLIFNINTTNTGTAAYVVSGIFISNTAFANNTIARNRIYNIGAAGTGTGTSAPTAYGIHINTQGAGNRYLNNQIMVGLNTSDQTFVAGIRDESTATDAFYFYNTILVNGQINSGPNNSYGIFRSSSSNMILRNNIVFNNRRTLGTGFNYATGATVATNITTATSNYNLFVVNDTARVSEFPLGVAYGIAAYNNNLYAPTFNTNWIERTGALNAADLFIDTVTANLAVDASKAACWYANGKALPLSGIATDFNNTGNVRSTAIVNGPSDIGSTEFNTVTIPPVANADKLPVLADSTQFTFAGRTLGKMVWNSGTLPSVVELRFYSGILPANLPVNASRIHGYYDINTNSTSGFNSTLTLQYDSSLLGNIGNISRARTARYTGTSTNWFGYSTINVNTGLAMVTSSNVAHGGIFCISDSAVNPLPVSLLNFAAKPMLNDVHLGWQTASEENNAGFSIEFSVDGKQFNEIEFVQGNGNSKVLSQYGYVHPDAFQYANTIYYRLKQIDFDGTFAYSEIVRVTKAINLTDVIQLIPNPAHSFTTIRFSTLPGNAQIEISDINGKTICQKSFQTLDGINELTIAEIEQFKPGFYFIKITAADKQTAAIKLIKQ